MAKNKKQESGFSDELKAALEALNHSYGEGTVIKINDSPNTIIERVSSGSLILDAALGGGYVKGALIEIFGEASLGKSTLALHFLSQFKGKPVLYIDCEQSLDKDYAEALGVDLDGMIITQPSCLEDGLSVMQELCDKVHAIVFDSVAEAAIKKEVEGDIGDQDIGIKAKLMSKAIRKLKATPHESTIMFINQVRAGMDMYNPRVTPGGYALKYGTHIRLDLSGRELIKKGSGTNEETVGHYAKIKVVKNKAGKPHVKCEVPIIYDGHGVSRSQEIVDLALEYGIFTKSGTWIKHNDTTIAQGLEGTRTFLQDNEEFAVSIVKELENKLKQ
jgi:recombination protein RecA